MTTTPVPPVSQLPSLGLLRLLQLCSTSFPTGAFAYSQGLEAAVDAGWVHDTASARDWITGQLTEFHPYVDLPALTQTMAACSAGDMQLVAEIATRQTALRDTRESREEEERVGRAALRTLKAQGLKAALAYSGPSTWAAAFGLAASEWGIDWQSACRGYLFTWAELQTLALTRLLPVGQRDAQALLVAGIAVIEAVVMKHSLHAPLSGRSLPGLSLAGTRHETQYSRLFLS